MSLGRLHLYDVVSRVGLNDDRAETEEGLAFAESFGVGVSLYFKVGKHLVFLLVVMGILQAPALVWYLMRGFEKNPPAFPFAVAAGSSGFGGATLARCSMAAVVSNGKYAAVVILFAALASCVLFFGSAVGGRLIRRDVSAMRTLSPRPEHYALLFRDVSEDATAAHVLRDCETALSDIKTSIVRVAVHHAGLRPALSKAVDLMVLDEAEKRNLGFFKRSHIVLFQNLANRRRRQRANAATQLDHYVRGGRGPAVACFVVFETPKAARIAAKILLFLPPGSVPTLGDRPRPSLAPSPADVIWENLEVSTTERYCTRFFVRSSTLIVVLAGLFAALVLRSSAIDEANIAVLGDDPFDDQYDNTSKVKAWFSRSAEPFVTRQASPRRRSVLTVLMVVLLNWFLRFIVRRGSVLESHSTRTTEQSAAFASYFASTTLNTLACYAVAAWRSAARFEDAEKVQVWYAEVNGYLLMNLLWEAFAPIIGAFLRSIARRLFGVALLDQKNRLSGTRRKKTKRRKRRSFRGGDTTEKTPLTELKDTTLNKNSFSIMKPEQQDILVTAPPPGEWSRTRKSVSQFLAAPGWDPVARSADTLRVFTIGAVFGAGSPLMPWLAAFCLCAMLAHDKWALLSERTPPELLGPHLSRTAAKFAPLAAPAHALLAMWTWSDLGSPLVCPASFAACAVTSRTWPLALLAFIFVAALLLSLFSSGATSSFSPRRRRKTRDEVDKEEDLDVYDDEPASTFFRRPDSEERLARDDPPWREARLAFQRKGIPYLYDVYDDARPLERERHPDFFRRWTTLDSTNDVARTVLQVFTPPRGLSDACDTSPSSLVGGPPIIPPPPLGDDEGEKVHHHNDNNIL